MVDEEFLDAFLDEANNNLQKLNENMVEFEKEGSEDALNECFRATHTIKSSAASMGFDDTSELSHRMEDVFDEIRDGEIEPGDKLFNLLYSSIDKLENFVEHIDEEQEQPDEDISEYMDNLEKAKKGEEFEDVEGSSTEDGEKKEIEKIEVDADNLDNLMNAVGELMIIEKKLREDLSPFDSRGVEESMNQFRRLGNQIQNDLTSARMVPVSQVFDRFPRMVRDVASKTDKDVEFEMEGTDLRLDRTVLDEIDEPIIHMIRNAVDHGIEPSDEREEKGKDPEGHIKLVADRKGDKATIAVEDDGAGIDTDKIRQKAIDKGVVSESEAEELSRQETMELLFDPDFSTNEEVTEISGRGVGMSVVRTTAERLQGTYSIESEEGEGTRIELELPISLAIVKCFVVKVLEQRYGIPINTVEHVKNLAPEEIQTLEGRKVFPFKDEEIPVVDLREKFAEDYEKGEDEILTVLVVYIGKEKAGLVVDNVTETEDFVIKDIDMVKQPLVAGSSILPDGTPLTILDTSNIIR